MPAAAAADANVSHNTLNAPVLLLSYWPPCHLIAKACRPSYIRRMLLAYVKFHTCRPQAAGPATVPLAAESAPLPQLPPLPPPPLPLPAPLPPWWCCWL